MSDLGSQNQPILSDSQRTTEVIDELKADVSMNINGYRIECQQYKERTVVTIDGREVNGSFTDAMKYAATLPVRWDGMF